MTEGSPGRHILFFAVPLVLGNLFQQLYSMVDAVIVGRYLGPPALAAVGATGPLNFFVLGFVFGLTSGYAVIVSQEFGSGNMERMRHSVAENIKLNAISALIFTVISLSTAGRVLSLMNTPEQIIGNSSIYITILFTGITPVIVYNGAACIMKALGDGKTPLYFLILSSFMNIALDIFFIKTAGWGIAGAAWATVISQAFSGIAAVVYIGRKFPLLRMKRTDFRFDPAYAVRHIAIGLPMALQFSITAVGVVVMQAALNRFGEIIIAGFSAAQKIENLLMSVPASIGQAMATYSGQNMGAGNIDRIRKGTYTTAYASVVLAVVATVFAYLCSEPILWLFLDGKTVENNTVVARAVEYMKFSSIFYIPLFLIFVYRNSLQGMGKTFMPMMGGVMELTARGFASLFFVIPFGYFGAYAANPLSWTAACLLLMVSFSVIMHRYPK
jgi:putative MATE family efflux protein